jgi:pre-mRNA-processing factor 6
VCVVAVARLFDKDHKVDKARKWFEQALTISPRLGDAWAYYYVFELRQQVNQTSKQTATTSELTPSNTATEDIIKRCVNSDPNRGELWCAVTKTTTLRRADIPTKLKKVAEQLLAR